MLREILINGFFFFTVISVFLSLSFLLICFIPNQFLYFLVVYKFHISDKRHAISMKEVAHTCLRICLKMRYFTINIGAFQFHEVYYCSSR